MMSSGRRSARSGWRASSPSTYGPKVSARVSVPSRSKTTSRTAAGPPWPSAILVHALARSGSLADCRELAQHIVQDAAVLVVLALLGGVDAHARLELQRRPFQRRSRDGHGLAGWIAAADDVETFLSGEPQRRRALAGQELQRQHAHSDEVGAMDALEALRDHGPDAQQHGALGGPVAR